MAGEVMGEVITNKSTVFDVKDFEVAVRGHCNDIVKEFGTPYIALLSYLPASSLLSLAYVPLPSTYNIYLSYRNAYTTFYFYLKLLQYCILSTYRTTILRYTPM